MKECKYKSRVIDYLYGELKAPEIKAHLENCPVCSELLRDFSATARLLAKRKRRMPPKELLYEYHQNLKQIYRQETASQRGVQKLLLKPTLTIRIVEMAAVLIIGILIGQYFSTPEILDRTVAEQNMVDTQFLNNYLFETELLLLDIANCDAKHDLASIVTDNKCKRLLQKTLVLKDQAKLENNARLLELLDRLELILLESANIEEMEELANLRNDIKDWHIFVELKAQTNLNTL